MIIRKMQKEIDKKQLFNIDASFSTEFIYRVTVKGLSIEIVEEKLSTPFQKTYPSWTENDFNESDYIMVAELEGLIVGFAAVKYEGWNNRAILSGLFVAPDRKRQKIGRALIDSIITYAKRIPARCLWLETQNVNYPAIQFYTKMGFQFCGFDNSLYNSDNILSDEVAFYFCRNL